ncbi:MAG TPA: deoxyribodipyrimidine photolyase, partial [Cryomorphaceae bacterium]|nr:deoxyribodipyrimidine photolyase [Cryomorphaceae bacterium]
IHEPWKIPPLQLALENIRLGDYPGEPIVDLSKARKHASDTLSAAKKSKYAAVESKRILAKHTNPGRRER